MRLYFHLVTNGEMIRDLDGVEVTDPGQAHTEALRALAEMRQENPSIPQDWSGWTLRVTEDRRQEESGLRGPLPGSQEQQEFRPWLRKT